MRISKKEKKTKKLPLLPTNSLQHKTATAIPSGVDRLPKSQLHTDINPLQLHCPLPSTQKETHIQTLPFPVTSINPSYLPPTLSSRACKSRSHMRWIITKS
ncbi:hypothetical protein L2E82_25614 [Cichorium intybus]|uniref:Uncharacterized protein n=1 Tax=Cichorium intybus TaxID=13427 RepID=A0ACB9E4R3_CICIN|nr:hypothetical protein L2E82_25614 [Cichorium intybus]